MRNKKCLDNFGTWDHRKITPERLSDLSSKYPDSFDYLIPANDSNGQVTIEYFSFNLYDLSHYDCISELVYNNYWLEKCTQLTLGCYIHDKELFDDFMQYWFPSKVRDLKIVHFEFMGQWAKIWNHELFKKNAQSVVNEVRLCRLKLDKDDIADLLELFNHTKSIWFMDCELDLDGQIHFKHIDYQIEMLSFINWYQDIHLQDHLQVSQIIDFLEDISASKLKKNLRFLNIHHKDISSQRSVIESLKARVNSTIIIENSESRSYLRSLQQSHYDLHLNNISHSFSYCSKFSAYK